MLKPFRYSGGKSRLLLNYRRPNDNIKRIVEPYLGSGIYSLSTNLPCTGFELNADVVAMWKWLQNTNAQELTDLSELVENSKLLKKVDVRELQLELGPQTYVRVNTAGLVTGQLTSWKIYPQHRLPIEQTIACLSRIKDMIIVHGNAIDYQHEDGDLLFIDPPYIGTLGGYIQKGKKGRVDGSYIHHETIELIKRTNNPVIFTYGSNAPVLFKDFAWSLIKTIKVPNVRSGGTTDRTEWVSYINW